MADVLAYRLNPRPVRAMASLSTLTVSTFYMVAQMVGAGALVALLLKTSGISYSKAVIGVGILMIVYVVVRRDAGDHVGADRESDLADGGNLVAQYSGAGALPFQLWRHFLMRSGTLLITTPKGQEVVKDFLQPGTPL